ncbi:MAG: pitrilysin family protein [Candidatus Eisenbacteria bacterium]
MRNDSRRTRKGTRVIGSNRLSRNCILVVLLLLPLLAPIISKAADGDLSTFDLANGLKIYAVEKHSSPIASVEVWYRTGSLDERPGIRGLSHLFEHMMFRGSEHFGPGEHFRRINQVGGTNGAYTSEDVTVYHQVVPVSAVDLVMEMEADRMARLNLGEEVLKTEVEVVKEEYRVTFENNPRNKILDHFCRQYFGDHPYIYDVIGVMEDLDTVSVATCLAYYESRYAPNNATLIIAGDVEPEQVLKMAEHHFGSISPRDSIAPDPPPPAPLPPQALYGKNYLGIPFAGVAYRLPPAGHPDILALEFLLRTLSDGLWYNLTIKSSLCVAAEVKRDFFRQASVVWITCDHLPGVSQEDVLSAIDGQIAGLVAQPFAPWEIEQTRNYMLLGETLGRARVAEITSGLGDALFRAGDLERYTRRIEQIEALTPEILLEIARRYLVPENRTELVIEPENPSPQPGDGE